MVSSMYLLTGPAVVHVDAGAENVDSFEAAPVLLQNQLMSATVLPDLLGPSSMPVIGSLGTSLGCLLVYSGEGNSFTLPMAFP